MPSFLRRVRALLRRDRLETELAEELETHRLLLAERLKRDGMESAAAETASRRAMGNATLAREDARAAWIAPWLESVWQDLRYGVRHLRAHPAFTITTGATLLLATVLNTSFFTLFNATVLRTWPVPDAGRVVIVHSRSAERRRRRRRVDVRLRVHAETGALVRRLVCDSRRRQPRVDDVGGGRRVHLRPVRVRERELLRRACAYRWPSGAGSRPTKTCKTGRHRSASSAPACGSGRSAEIAACSVAPST